MPSVEWTGGEDGIQEVQNFITLNIFVQDSDFQALALTSLIVWGQPAAR